MKFPFTIQENFIDTHVQNDPKYVLERTYFITTSDNTICIIAVLDAADNICQLSVEDRFLELLENKDSDSIVVISKSNNNQVKWLSDNLNNFLKDNI